MSEQDQQGQVIDNPGDTPNPMLDGLSQQDQAAVVQRMEELNRNSQWAISEHTREKNEAIASLTAAQARLEGLMEKMAAAKDEPREAEGSESAELLDPEALNDPVKFYRAVQKMTDSKFRKMEQGLKQELARTKTELAAVSAQKAEELVTTRLTEERQVQQNAEQAEFMKSNPDWRDYSDDMRKAIAIAWDGGNGVKISLDQALKEAKSMKEFATFKASKSRQKSAPSAPPSVNPDNLQTGGDDIAKDAREAMAQAKRELAAQGYHPPS